jgi:hypothetical protein
VDNAEYWFGYADFEGHRAFATGLVNLPGIALGVDIDNNKFSLKTEALMTIAQRTYFGNTSIGRIKPELTGFVFTFAHEGALWKKNIMILGIKINYAKPLYQVWLAFSDFDKWKQFPELFIGYVF